MSVETFAFLRPLALALALGICAPAGEASEPTADPAEGAAGKPYAGELKSLVADRRQYFDHWHNRRSAMPKVLGAVPESVEDPVLIEIFGWYSTSSSSASMARRSSAASARRLGL